MTDGIKGYLLSLTAAALVCTLVQALAGKKGSTAALVKLLAGVFMAITLVKPLLHVRWLEVLGDAAHLRIDASQAVEEGQLAMENALSEIITQRTRAYIEDKAQQLGANLAVEISLSDSIPCGVTITGPVSPYVKSQLSAWIQDNIGIDPEEQKWIY